MCCGEARRGAASRGGLGVFWCGEIRRFWRVTVRYGEAWQGGLGELRRGVAWRGVAVELRFGKMGSGRAGHGMAV